MTPSPVVLILAAGRGERFLASGGKTHKLAARLGDKSVLEHVIHAVDSAGLAWHLVNPVGGTGGMGESISLGVHATSDASGWLILPADLPLVQPHTLQRVADALLEKPVVVPCFDHQQGHPVAFGRKYGEKLRALYGDTGARQIVKDARQRGDVTDLMLADRGITQDIDTLADLEAARRSFLKY